MTDSRGVTRDQTGFRFPAGTGHPANAWTNPSNAYSDNGLSAVSPALLTASQDWSSFGLEVPSSVTGIEVLLDMQSNALNLLASTSVTLSWNAGSNYTTPCSSSQLLSLGGSLYRCGGATNTWQRAWSASELSNQNFRARVTFSGVLGLNLDYLAVNVHYAPFTAGRSVFNLNASSRVTFADQNLLLTGLPAGTIVYTDGAPGALVGSGFRQIAIVSPTPIVMSNVLLGESIQSAPNFHGRMDDLRVYEEALSAAEIATLFERPACAP
jgi:hypothetical protein